MRICLYGVEGVSLGNRNLKDPRLDEAHRLVEAKKKVYAQVELVDDSELSNCDAILVHGDHRADLILKDLEFIENRLTRDPDEAERSALLKLNSFLEEEKTVREASLSDDERAALAAHTFTTSKPVIAATSAELQDLDPLLLRAFAEGGHISFLTVGGKENRAWPIRAGISAVEAAGTIHTDMQKGFIRAEIISYADFVEAGGETQAKRAGKQRLEIKTYVMQDYDVVNFRFNR